MKTMCPDCLTVHTKDTLCPEVNCPSCGEAFYSPAEARGCPKVTCPMAKDVAAFEQPNVLSSSRFHQTRMPGRGR